MMSLAENLPENQLVISEELILVQQADTDKEAVLRSLADLLQRQGYVKASFSSAVLDREKVFPTGLMTQVTGVAIPHTNSSHVNRSAIAIAILQQPVEFMAMDNPASSVPVEIVIMLAIKEPESQLTILQKIMQILNRRLILSGLKNARTTAEVMAILNAHLSS